MFKKIAAASLGAIFSLSAQALVINIEFGGDVTEVQGDNSLSVGDAFFGSMSFDTSLARVTTGSNYAEYDSFDLGFVTSGFGHSHSPRPHYQSQDRIVAYNASTDNNPVPSLNNLDFLDVVDSHQSSETVFTNDGGIRTNRVRSTTSLSLTHLFEDFITPDLLQYGLDVDISDPDELGPSFGSSSYTYMQTIVFPTETQEFTLHNSFSFDVTSLRISTVPEPGSLGFILIGGIALGLRRTFLG